MFIRKLNIIIYYILYIIYYIILNDNEENAEWIDTIPSEDEDEENATFVWDEHFEDVRRRAAAVNWVGEINFSH